MIHHHESVFQNFDTSDLDKIQEILEDEYFDVILKAKSVYEICLLSSILGNNKYLSDSRVEMYERHRQDLKNLKLLLAEYDKDAYEKIFRTMDKGSYSAYVGDGSIIVQTWCR